MTAPPAGDGTTSPSAPQAISKETDERLGRIRRRAPPGRPPASERAHWGGSTDDDGPVETWGDYGRACSVQGYIGLVDVGGQRALVLGDEPASTTYLADERLFLRWAAADSEAELIAAAKRALQGHVQRDEDEDLIWDVREPVVLFDSAWPGAEVEADNHLVIDVEPGRYRVRATYFSDFRYAMMDV